MIRFEAKASFYPVNPVDIEPPWKRLARAML